MSQAIGWLILAIAFGWLVYVIAVDNPDGD